MDKTFKFRKSLTKNWPGGRKNATVIETKDNHSYPTWNKRVVENKATWTNGVRSYLAPLPPPTEGGMADPGV